MALTYTHLLNVGPPERRPRAQARVWRFGAGPSRSKVGLGTDRPFQQDPGLGGIGLVEQRGGLLHQG